MLFKDVRLTARKYIEAARFEAMLAVFMKRACSVETQRVARLVGNVDESEELFNAQFKQQFEKIIELQGGGDAILVPQLSGSKTLLTCATAHRWKGAQSKSCAVFSRIMIKRRWRS